MFKYQTIKYEEYKKLSESERENWNVFPKLNAFNVFNIEQTNIKEQDPALYEELTKRFNVYVHENSDTFRFCPVDTMIDTDRWVCKINPTKGDDAYYSISKDHIVVPLMNQFRDNASFYSNLFHEMAHSTGAESRLNRLKPSAFGSKEYAREELVAELTAALVSARYGIQKHIKDDSAAYLKNWLDSLKEDPKYIKTILIDVRKASNMIVEKIEEQKEHAKTA